MIKCGKCNKTKEQNLFIDAKGKQHKTCFDCRETSRLWREKNKETVSLYNKNYNEKKLDNKEIDVVYARKANTNDQWQKFDSQLDLSKKLNLFTSNINKVIKGQLKTTGGYEIKLEKEIYTSKASDWTDIKEENNIINKVKGQPSINRITHESIDDIIGKKCSNCKKWEPLTNYNKSEKHWDKLRNDCIHCLKKYRKDNREKIQKHNTKYERDRKKIDPAFKLVKTLRSRLGTALKNQKAIKSDKTMELVGCTIPFLRGYLEAKFKVGMSWDNHGEWHIDHIKPCASFNLLNEEEQKKCFHYKNLQPLWADDNLSKGAKHIEI